ncbi:hypothetical protein HPB52_000129 [Rhipicephalus sanguineus]|uniref:Uncharacterized protein n=1 Tax=Rhipicephalus sanguineus TaxID=34632 RepID=A0A9D4Q3Q5_RHISA|nr:hypothetical protein HPB52_000129 [Rhipicephalus sanguineus]
MDATFRRYVEISLELGEPSHGIKGFSPLARLPGFDSVWSVCPDYMHNVLEGVAKQLADIWFGSPGSPSYIGPPENDHISRDEVGVATDGFSDFALKVEPLYGTGAMSFNVHQLLYLPKRDAEDPTKEKKGDSVVAPLKGRAAKPPPCLQQKGGDKS